MSKRILYLSYDGMTDPLGQSQVLPYLKKLSGLGYNFTLISFEKPEIIKRGGEQVQQLCIDSGIQWYPLNYTKFPPVLSTLRDLWVLKKTIKELQHGKPFDMVHCRSYIVALAGLWMKRSFAVKFVFDMRGFWADERVEGGIWNLKNPVYKLIYHYFKKKERAFLTRADFIISLTSNAKKEMEQWEGSKMFAPIDVIPCCADLSLFDSSLIERSDIIETKEKLNLSAEQTVISYIGSLGTWYMVDEMLDFFKALLKAKPKSVFLFVTKDPKTLIENKAKQRGIPLSSLRITAAERSKMPLLISLSSFSIFFIKPVFSKKASSPTKQGEIMAMGVPIVCNDKIGDTSEIVKKYQSGVIVDVLSENKYNEVIKNLFTMDFNGSLIREGAQSFFSLESGVKKYASVYRRVLQNDDKKLIVDK